MLPVCVLFFYRWGELCWLWVADVSDGDSPASALFQDGSSVHHQEEIQEVSVQVGVTQRPNLTLFGESSSWKRREMDHLGLSVLLYLLYLLLNRDTNPAYNIKLPWGKNKCGP